MKAFISRRVSQNLDIFFRISERKSTVSREMLAGMTTFAAMSYIVVVNPMVLAAAGMNRQGVLLATVLSAVIGTLAMALWANLPVALAPGMGSNIVFAQVVVLQMHLRWQTALAMVFLNAVVFLILSLTRWREKIVAAFPESIKLGMQCSIGIFIAFLGLKNAGLIIADPGSLLAFAKLSNAGALLALVGVLLTAVLLVRKTPGGFLISIAVLTVAGLFLKDASGHAITQPPQQWFSLPQVHPEMLFAFDFREFFSKFFVLLPVTVYFLVSEFFSATATLIGVARRAGLSTPSEAMPNAKAAFASDALASAAGAALGTSTVTAFVESVAGVEAGARTGLSGVIVAALFALTLLISPLLSVIPPQAVAPALVLVGALMMEDIRQIDRNRAEEVLPPLLMIIFTVCTMDLMAGLAVGCFSYTLLAISLKQWKKVTTMLLTLDGVFVLYLVLRNKIG
ncbi:NCS2 family permease [Granulicella arctica]|uniref:AGZA family xanthine/uracil permease-like MFS transporter n=1 Tax=Granulicella arctica TaxID=940613 RepID=A0A7Y9TH81_9BACT|nr:NCS2 family permease [Granulicella arctica]NYF80771.1 AGZA family xanthine/uracil permease-like MFS transporter [Granulicella arctica]